MALGQAEHSFIHLTSWYVLLANGFRSSRYPIILLVYFHLTYDTYDITRMFYYFFPFPVCNTVLVRLLAISSGDPLVHPPPD